MTLDEYIDIKATEEFDIFTNNCIDFTVGYYTNLKPIVEKYGYNNKRKILHLFERPGLYKQTINLILTRYGFKKSQDCFEQGNLIIAKYEGIIHIGIRYNDLSAVFMGEKGVVFIFDTDYENIKEYEPCHRLS